MRNAARSGALASRLRQQLSGDAWAARDAAAGAGAAGAAARVAASAAPAAPAGAAAWRPPPAGPCSRPRQHARWLSGATSQQQRLAFRPCGPARSLYVESLDRREASMVDSFYNTAVETYAQLPTAPLSLRRLLEGGRSAALDAAYVTQNAQEVQRELPRRLARRLFDLQLLPHIVVTNPHVTRVYHAYYHAFEVLRQLPPVLTPADNVAFCSLLRRLVDEHGPLLDSLARGLREAKSRALVGPALQLDGFLDSMLRSRITRRVLAEQHLAMSGGGGGGVVQGALRVAEAAEFAGQRAAMLCEEIYGVSPEVRVTGDTGAVLPYIPSHLDYMLYELLKNAVRATVERHLPPRAGGAGGGATPPPLSARLLPVQVRVCAGPASVTLRISDQGGGIPEANTSKVWAYGFTTSGDSPGGGGGGGGGGDGSLSGEDSFFGRGPVNGGGGGSGGIGLQDLTGGGLQEAGGATAAAAGGAAGGGFGLQLSAASEAPRQRYKLAGLGFGLPLSRLYARYFGGDLALQNVPGFGVDAFLTLRDLAEIREDTSLPGERDAAP